MKKCLTIVLVFTSCFCISQIQTIYVKPVQTDINYDTDEDSSAVSRNVGFQLNKLFLFFGGTGSSSSSDYNAIRLHAANIGFDFINLSYPNNVAAASLSNSADSLSFNKYRQEVCYGTPLSNDVSVDSLNSIYTRTLKLIEYLSDQFPSENWGQYLASPGILDWSKIIVGGHSQGSGHACYLAKLNQVDRVLMFAGPNDYSEFYDNSANWVRQPGITPVDRHFSYLSLYDEAVAYFKQLEVVSGLEMMDDDDSTCVDELSSPYENSHCLYTTQSPGLVILNHNAPIMLSAINNGVWTYMLTSNVSTEIDRRDETTDVHVYPNPADQFINFSFPTEQNEITFSIMNLSGETIRTETSRMHLSNYRIDIIDLEAGLYLVRVGSVSTKIVKN